MRGLMWFRADLRVNDNTALFNASRHCRDGVLGVFLIPRLTWKDYRVAPCKVDLILRQLHELKNQLATVNIPLYVKVVDDYEACIQDILTLCETHQIKAVHYNREYELNEIRRDQKANLKFEAAGIKAQAYDDLLIAPPGKILTAKGEPYQVFTSFKKSWLAWMPRHGNIQPIKTPELQVEAFTQSTDIPTQIEGFSSTVDPALWPAGEVHAYAQLERFVSEHLFEYASTRDYPMLDATSRLSPYLNIGAISARQCLNLAICAPTVKSSEHVDAWVSELIWREFYKHVSFHFPQVCKGEAFHSQYNKMTWNQRPDWISAWQKGETGYPLVDAGMKQLLQTGFMHNRLRMVTSMFFSKLMNQDWHLGEAFFMEHLIDGDFSANNGGWQWCASTGTDAAPYFRMFNPIRQSENFDAQGDFIKQYIPELRDFSSQEIHEPHVHNPALASASGYPKPILDFSTQRQITLKNYKALA